MEPNTAPQNNEMPQEEMSMSSGKTQKYNIQKPSAKMILMTLGLIFLGFILGISYSKYANAGDNLETEIALRSTKRSSAFGDLLSGNKYKEIIKEVVTGQSAGYNTINVLDTNNWVLYQTKDGLVDFKYPRNYELTIKDGVYLIQSPGVFHNDDTEPKEQRNTIVLKIYDNSEEYDEAEFIMSDSSFSSSNNVDEILSDTSEVTVNTEYGLKTSYCGEGCTGEVVYMAIDDKMLEVSVLNLDNSTKLTDTQKDVFELFIANLDF